MIPSYKPKQKFWMAMFTKAEDEEIDIKMQPNKFY